jgi:polysaccharide biosynthesis/export protein
MSHTKRHVAAVLAVGNLLVLSACAALPSAGPSGSEITHEARDEQDTKDKLGAHIVQLTPGAVATLLDQKQDSLSVIGKLGNNVPVDLLGPGDVVSITVYEAGDGLFTPHASDETDTVVGASSQTLPRLQVDRNGDIDVPYAGRVHAAGHTLNEVQNIVQNRLSTQTAGAQVIVSMVANANNIVYVSGDVRNPGRYPLSLAHERLLDMVALAGGPSHSPQDTLVKVNRGDISASTTLTRVQTVPAENIEAAPQDRIQFDYLPRSYMSFGATGRVAQIPFDAVTVTLAEAVARAGGLDDNRANPEAVFLFRYEKRATAEALGLIAPGAPLPRPQVALPYAMADGVPVIYQINMRDPQTYFLIQQFLMQDKDLIYISNAPTVQLFKFLQLIYTIATPTVTAKTLSE